VTLPAQPNVSTVRRRVLTESVIVLAVFLASAIWATSFWHAWTAQGNRGAFYQTYFEPAVMIACGKGFVISNPQPKPLEDFLWERRQTFECSEIPADTPLGTRFLYQGAWRYLLTAVGLGWKITGIGWNSIGPIVGTGFGISIAVAYGIFRLAMGQWLALIAVAGLAVSSTQLLNMPHLRDYAKTPFTLLLVLLIGLLVTLPVRRWLVLSLAAACGVVIGVGYGFRTDFLINIPLPIAAVFLFLQGGVLRNLLLKTAAAAVFVATFAVVSWPITSTVYERGGCQWHVSLLGLQAPFDDYLRIAPAPYTFGHAYSDSYIDRLVNGYRWRHEPEVPQLVFCSHEYDVESGAYLQRIVRTFPADILARSYASVLQVVELPFRGLRPPVAGWFEGLYQARAEWLRPDHRWGLFASALAIMMLAATSVRLALVVLMLLVYFGGYPAVQFQERHYFHLEFIGWWAIGLVIAQLWRAAGELRAGLVPRAEWQRRVVRATASAAGILLLLVTTLTAVRAYQSSQVRPLLQSYIDAPKVAVDAPGEPLAGVTATQWPQLLEVQIDQAACGDSPAVTFKYDTVQVGLDFTATVALSRRSTAPGVTRMFVPVYEKFIGIESSDAQPGCVVGVSRLADVRPFPLLLGATLPPDWANRPLYQRLADWESGY